MVVLVLAVAAWFAAGLGLVAADDVTGGGVELATVLVGLEFVADADALGSALALGLGLGLLDVDVDVDVEDGDGDGLDVVAFGEGDRLCGVA